MEAPDLLLLQVDFSVTPFASCSLIIMSLGAVVSGTNTQGAMPKHWSALNVNISNR